MYECIWLFKKILFQNVFATRAQIKFVYKTKTNKFVSNLYEF